MKTRTRPHLRLTILGLATLSAASALIAGPTLPTALTGPQSRSGINAITKYNDATKNTYNAWRTAQLKTEQQLLTDLDTSLKIAMQANQLDEAEILNRLRKDTEERIAQLKNPTTAPASGGHEIILHYSNGGVVQLHPDGTATATENSGRKRPGTWKQAGQTLALTWDSGLTDTFTLTSKTTAHMINRNITATIETAPPTTQP